MKKIAVLFFSALLLLFSCAKEQEVYFDTVSEAYLKAPYYSVSENTYYDTVTAEVGLVSVSDRFGIWLAVVNEEMLLVQGVVVQDAKYGLGENNELYAIQNLQEAGAQISPEELIYSGYTVSKALTLYFKVVPRAALLEEARNADGRLYTYTDLDIPYKGGTVPVTAIYYFLAQNT